MLPPAQFHPSELDTFGLGAVLRAAQARHPRQTIVGIGGSATNDAGFGLARAWGWQFLDATGKPILRWTELTGLHRILGFSTDRRALRLTIAVDVKNRLLGPRGATRIYGPQKGLQPEDLRPAERALGRLVRVLEQQDRFQAGLALRPGAGAAGGLGFGLSAFVGGCLEPGFDLFGRHTRFAERLWKADLVVTGEGAIDQTTVSMGKGVGQIARFAHQARKPCVGLAGVVNLGPVPPRRFTRVAGIVPRLATVEQATSRAAEWLAALARQVATSWSPA
jgi:glycerate kinase